MKYWIQKTAWILSVGSFFVFFFCGLNYADPFAMPGLVIAVGKALLIALFVWISGFVIADILLKGVVEDIDVREADVIENGLIQHVFEKKHLPKVKVEDSSISTHEAATRRNKQVH